MKRSKVVNKQDKSKDKSSRVLSIRTVPLPRDTNSLGSIFGGYILSLIDLAAGQHARGVAEKKYVTKLMTEVNFIAPVYLGDTVSLYTTTKRVGRTSVSIYVDVEATRAAKSCKVTSAEVVMVAVNSAGNPIPIY